MPEPIPDWRRHEPLVQDETVNRAALENANAVLLRTTREELRTLRDAFNLVLRENERLLTECEKLRTITATEAEEWAPSVTSQPSQRASSGGETGSGKRDPDFQALSEGVQALEAKLSSMMAPQPPEGAPARATGIPLSQRSPIEQERVLEKVSELIARWVFSKPSHAQTRLIRDALRGRWLVPRAERMR